MGAKAETAAQQPSLTRITVEASPAETEASRSREDGSRAPGDAPGSAPPRMHLLPLAALSAVRGFPSYAAAARSGILVPCAALDRSKAFVVFMSHRWVPTSASAALPGMPSSPPPGVEEAGERMACRSDVGFAKHGLAVEGLNLIKETLPQEVGIFVWIDCSCIDEVGSVVIMRLVTGQVA